MANARIQVPTALKRGQAFEVRLLIRHPMETGFRHDEVGKAIPQNVIKDLTCRYNGVEVFRAELFPGIAANPYLSFLPRPPNRASWKYRGRTTPDSTK